MPNLDVRSWGYSGPNNRSATRSGSVPKQISRYGVAWNVTGQSDGDLKCCRSEAQGRRTFLDEFVHWAGARDHRALNQILFGIAAALHAGGACPERAAPNQETLHQCTGRLEGVHSCRSRPRGIRIRGRADSFGLRFLSGLRAPERRRASRVL